MRTGRWPLARRILAALLAGICLPLAAPGGASAEEEEKNLWAQWWKGATDRGIKAEIPFAVLVTIPAMLIVTPVWLIERGYERLTSEDEGSSEDEDS